MKHSISHLFLILPLILISGCGIKHEDKIDEAYAILSNNPDSALFILNAVRHQKLVRAELARYALVYSMAQNKSGLNVDNDSLLRIAHDYYNDRTEDSLYGKFAFYMGCYYVLNDSIEKATAMLSKSMDFSEASQDKYTEALAAERLSMIMGNINPQKAVELSQRAVRLTDETPTSSRANVVYTRLQLARQLMAVQNYPEAEQALQTALCFALLVNDSMVISDTYQDMARLYAEKHETQKSLQFALKMHRYSPSKNNSKLIRLAWSYLDADSLAKAMFYANKIKQGHNLDLYVSTYLKHIVAIKRNNAIEARLYADSAYQYIEEMYIKELASKDTYYQDLMEVQNQMAVQKDWARNLIWITIVVSLLSFAIIILLYILQRQHKSKTNSIIRERELELHYKETQLSIMRSYLMKKIDVVQRVQKIKENKEKVIVLDDADWEELRTYVDSVEGSFTTRLQNQFQNLTQDDIKLVVLLRLKLSSKALSLIYGISEKSIRQKLFVFKGKVGLAGKKTSLREFIESF